MTPSSCAAESSPPSHVHPLHTHTPTHIHHPDVNWKGFNKLVLPPLAAQPCVHSSKLQEQHRRLCGQIPGGCCCFSVHIRAYRVNEACVVYRIIVESWLAETHRSHITTTINTSVCFMSLQTGAPADKTAYLC